jgi:hypothetical protein
MSMKTSQTNQTTEDANSMLEASVKARKAGRLREYTAARTAGHDAATALAIALR